MNLFWATNLLIPSIIINWLKWKRIPLPSKIAIKGKQFLSKLQNLIAKRFYLKTAMKKVENDADKYLTDVEENKDI